MQITYETHFKIKQDELCPFKHLRNNRIDSGNCNWHKNIEVILTESGVGNVQYGGAMIRLTPDLITVVNSGVIHRFYCEHGFDFSGLIIDDSFCEENGFDIEGLELEKCFFDAQTKALIIRAMADIDRYKDSGAQIDAAKARLTVLELLIDLTERHSVNKSGTATATRRSSGGHVKSILRYLNEHYTEPLQLDNIAKMCGVTKCHLVREFKRFTGTTVCTYTNLLRCQHAETCILDGMNITEAALASGFESLSYFSRTYKKLKGKLPSKIKASSATEQKRKEG